MGETRGDARCCDWCRESGTIERELYEAFDTLTKVTDIVTRHAGGRANEADVQGWVDTVRDLAGSLAWFADAPFEEWPEVAMRIAKPSSV
ncbi:hypothetical protein [Candidatus Palauibacter sp.]|uniref:hypothetical protein n=1 Tax=Candidatus Palauibacter sp. TaxID=3101350 RepID=UPI003B524199